MRLAFTEGKWFVIIAVVALVLLAWVNPYLGLVPLAVLIFILYFFRDPLRVPINHGKQVLSSADGVVTRVRKVDCDFVGQDVWEVTVFMSPFNVHVNRSPVAGSIASVQHVPGKFLPAMNPEAPMENEKNIICIQGSVKVKVIQIAGIVARRTVSWVKGGEDVGQGDKIGMIKFSSCTQTFFPGNFKVKVSQGSKVQAGMTVIGEEE